MLKNSLLFPVIQSIHLAGIALMMGTIILSDLRVLGHSHKSLSQSWTVAGGVILAITGPLLFGSDIPRYLSNPAFVLKVALLTLTIVFHFTIHRRQTRMTAILSMILWSCVVLAGRAIADFDV